MCRFRVRLSLICIREPCFRSIMTSHMFQGSRARTRQRVETGFGSGLAVTVDNPSRLVPHREIDRNSSFEKVARGISATACAVHLCI